MAIEQFQSPDQEATEGPAVSAAAEVDYYQEHKLTAPDHYRPTDYDHSVDGYTELLEELKETTRAVGADFKKLVTTDESLRIKFAQPKIDAINAERERTNQQPISIENVSSHFLIGLAEPAWKEVMPKDPADPEQVKRWYEYKAQFPNHMQDNLEYMYECHAKVDVLQDDETLQQKFGAERQGRIEVVRAATQWRRAESEIKKLSHEMANIRKNASLSGRKLTARERRALEDMQKEIAENSSRGAELTTVVDRDDLITELDRLDRRDSKNELDNGLLMTDQMKDIIDESLPALSRGEPALFVGETGGAKTALAEYITKEYFGVEPEFVSGYGDVNSYQLMGSKDLEERNGATVSSFGLGPIVRAMELGIPLIVDEINAIPPEILKRFNKIMQLRPGDKFTIQEDSGREITVAPGFCIIATANEKSKRYKGVDDLSVEFQNRFGANIYRVRYPDSDNGFEQPPIENDRLATAAVVDKHGVFPDDLDPTDFDNFVKAAFVSQQVFSGNFGEGFTNYVSMDRMADSKPGLEETVIAPRTMVDILRKAAGSHGEVSIKAACRRFLDGIKNENDKRQMHLILSSHGLLDQVE